MTELPDTALLEAKGLTVVMPHAPTVALADAVDLRVPAGGVVDIAGPSGSGKTALLRALARMLPGATGGIYLQGRAAQQFQAHEWRCLVAMLPQKPAIVDGSVAENLLLPWRLKVRHGQQPPRSTVLEESLASLGMSTISPDRDAARLSVGQQARIALLRVLLTGPKVLLLDEVDAALDDASAEFVRTRLAQFAETGGGIVRVRHRADDGLATERFRLESGRLREVS